MLHPSCRSCAQRHRWWPEITARRLVVDEVNHWVRESNVSPLCSEIVPGSGWQRTCLTATLSPVSMDS